MCAILTEAPPDVYRSAVMDMPSQKILTGPRLAPASGGPAKALIILIHGYGADGADLMGLAPHWQRLLPDAAFAAPNAPERCEMQPMGYQWFGISRLDPTATAAGVTRAAPLLDAFIDAELARLGLDGTRLVLVGFSQGTMMALHVGLRRQSGPAAIVGFSGLLAAPERLSEITAKPPVLLIHGDADEVIPVSASQAAAQALGGAGIAAQWHISSGLGHGIDPQGLALGGAFIHDSLTH